MRAIHLALKDLQQLIRDPKVALFALLMPIGFTLLLGVMMGNQVRGSVERPLVAWVDHDASEASAALAGLLRQSDTVRLEAMSQAEAEQAVSTGRAAAAVIVPGGAGQALNLGAPTQVRLLAPRTPGSDALVAAKALEAATARLASAAQAARLSSNASASWRPFADAAAARSYFEAGLERARELWAAPALSLRLETRPSQALPVPSGFGQSSPGMLVQFTVFNLMGAAIVLVLERQSGALRRLLTTPIGKGGVIAGKMLAVFVVALVQDLILVAVGQLAFGVGYLSSPLATLAMVVSFSFCMAALGILVGAVATSEGVAAATTLVLMFVLTGMGGAWFPLEITGPTFAAIGHLFPSAWAMDGFHSILWRGAGLAGVAYPVGALLAYGLAFGALAVWRFRFD